MPDAIQDVPDLGLDDVIVNMDAIAPRLNNVAPSHLCQVLGNDGLGKVQNLLDLSHRFLFFFQKLKDPQAIRVAHDFDDVGGLP
jgi:hypothetical protein